MQLGVPGAHSNEGWSVARLLRFDRSVDLPGNTQTRARLSGTRSPVSLFCSRVANALACANGVGWRAAAADTVEDHRSPLSARCARVCDGGLALRVSVRPCRRRRGAGTSGAMRMRARLSGARSLVSLFCSRVASALAFAALGRGDGRSIWR